MPSIEDNCFILPWTVPADAIDGLGHTNNAAYIPWCEAVAWQHSELLGLSLADYQATNKAMAIRQAHYDYHQPSFEADKLEIITWLSDCDGKLRLRRNFQIKRCSDQVLIMEAYWNFICINIKTGKPSRMPESYLSAYATAALAQPMRQED
ncbi:MAG: thioesterase family protein [Pseudomonadales bacterium]